MHIGGVLVTSRVTERLSNECERTGGVLEGWRTPSFELDTEKCDCLVALIFFRIALSPPTRDRSPYFLLENALVALVDVAAGLIFACSADAKK